MALRRGVSFVVAVGLAAALSLGGALPTAVALGEADGLYSVGDGDDGQFVQLDTTNAAATLIGSSTTLYQFTAVEVVNGLGYAIGVIVGPDPDIQEDDALGVFTWNIATGAVLTAVPLTGSFDIRNVYALDTRMDGVLLTYAEFTDGSGELFWLSSIDPATGALTPLVDLDLADENLIFEGIATNPVDGVTYALADFDNGMPSASPIDFGSGTVGASIDYPDVQDSLGNGYFIEGDFDESGVLWFTYTGAGVSRSDAPFEVGVEATELGQPAIRGGAITIGTTIDLSAEPAEPELAATGGVDLMPSLGVGALVAALGAVLMIARRTRSVRT